MIFRICKTNEPILYQREIVRLEAVDEEDKKLNTSFLATYYDLMGREHPLGLVKIGFRGMKAGKTADALPKEFAFLPKGFFSLGQDEDYYEHISHLEQGARVPLLKAMRDLAAYPDDLDDLVKDENEAELCGSLLKRIAQDQKVAVAKIKGQYRNMTKGGARLTPYSFTYTAPEPSDKEIPPVRLEFRVDPKPYPPTNVHALIGRNGCGKTFIIRHMVQCLQEREGDYGKFEYKAEQDGQGREFVNVICIAFSPFDDFASLIKEDGLLPATFVGLRSSDKTLLDSIFDQFWKHFQNCLVTERKQELWKKTIGTLTSDAIFEREGIGSFMDDLTPGTGEAVLTERQRTIRETFDRLSSGHKVVLLIATSAVAEVEERSILFLDEPENHLHPPLLSALIRALSDLLMDRNGVAIISTHSPIVLQEIPSSCVWVLDRNAKNKVRALRPNRETFGTNLGALLYDTFDLEMGRSGFRRLIREAAEQFDSYDEVEKEFDKHLGNEAALLLRTLLMLRERGK